ncbi:Glycosyltransferase family 2 protein [Rhodovastum atsumiense]|uniref:Glycosyltransferase family 2 protein n=1 Tax=Rhodovastum atsumiense TaxID=504468 RepID=A0A5M6ITW8_9PROT|nr:glycosyltransferase family 2 protein [Rhodovastum atsumiense]KAA5611287.1 glycosyltransferase family 2 protein [Rhodovastum atsumiense]CAH2601751.1 Glycosyltransferase family 2 protein [Rhodovastum atsumiense]
MKSKIHGYIFQFLNRFLPIVKKFAVSFRTAHLIARFIIRLALRLPWFGPRFNRALQRITAPEGSYADWIALNEPRGEADHVAIRMHIARFRFKPLISVIMPAYNTREALLREAITSVTGQLYENWELCIADDASTTPMTWKVLQEFAAGDRRIKIVRRAGNGHICHASNSALALATGEFVALMDHDDRLPPHALYEVVAEINAHPNADLIFSDEDKFNDLGVRSNPYFKPGWDPELLLSQNIVSHLGVYRRSILNKIGGFRPGFEGSQDYDLTLRFSEHTSADRIRHIPTVLYHWRQGGQARSFSESQLRQCAEAARRAVLEHLERTGVKGASVTMRDDMPGWVKVERPVPARHPRVSVIIPTRDRSDLLSVCVDGLLHRTDYENLEVIIVNNGSVEQKTFTLFQNLARDRRVRLLNIDGPFNYSLLNNRAAEISTGEIILLLNNDVEVIDPGWLKAMVAQAIRPEVGAVGARLLYGDGRVQHGGVVVGAGHGPSGEGGVANHILLGSERNDPGYFGILLLAHEASAVTGACLALRRSVFEEIGGLDERALTVAFNDVDLCLKIRQRGYKIIWTPLAELYHHESASRGLDTDPDKRARFEGEIATMLSRWGSTLANDPYYNPNLSLVRADYQLARHARRQVPWRQAQPMTGDHEVFVLRTSSGQDLGHVISVCERIAERAPHPPILLDASGDRGLLATFAAMGDPCRLLTATNPSLHEAAALVLQVSRKAEIYAFPDDIAQFSRIIAEIDPASERIQPVRITG